MIHEFTTKEVSTEAALDLGGHALDFANIVNLRSRGYNHGMATMSKSRSTQRRAALKASKKRPAPVWEEILKIVETIPAQEFHKLPTDLAVNHDHYLYGTSLR